MNTLARRGDLSTAEKELLFACLQDVIGLPYSPRNAKPEGFDSSGLVAYVFREVCGINVNLLSDWIPPKTGGIKIHDVRTGDIVYIEESGSPQPIPAIAVGIVEKQIVYASPRFQSVVIFDLGYGAEGYRVSGCRKGSDLWIGRPKC
jgi:hypothetical protein